jgi:hypothetical protein
VGRETKETKEVQNKYKTTINDELFKILTMGMNEEKGRK